MDELPLAARQHRRSRPRPATPSGRGRVGRRGRRGRGRSAPTPRTRCARSRISGASKSPGSVTAPPGPRWSRRAIASVTGCCTCERRCSAGDDVGELQRRLGALGFDAGRVDAIFGPLTEAALKDFERNAGLTTDGVCGPDVLAELTRLGSRGEGASVAGVRERERLAPCAPGAARSTSRRRRCRRARRRGREIGQGPAGRRRDGRGAQPSGPIGAGGRGEPLRSRRVPRVDGRRAGTVLGRVLLHRGLRERRRSTARQPGGGHAQR